MLSVCLEKKMDLFFKKKSSQNILFKNIVNEFVNTHGKCSNLFFNYFHKFILDFHSVLSIVFSLALCNS